MNALALLLSVVVFGVSLRIQDRANQALAKALREREEAEAFYQQAIVRNDEAIQAQTEAGRMLEAARAVAKEHKL